MILKVRIESESGVSEAQEEISVLRPDRFDVKMRIHNLADKVLDEAFPGQIETPGFLKSKKEAAVEKKRPKKKPKY